jgi:hypothetical protein
MLLFQPESSQYRLRVCQHPSGPCFSLALILPTGCEQAVVPPLRGQQTRLRAMKHRRYWRGERGQLPNDWIQLFSSARNPGSSFCSGSALLPPHDGIRGARPSNLTVRDPLQEAFARGVADWPVPSSRLRRPRRNQGDATSCAVASFAFSTPVSNRLPETLIRRMIAASLRATPRGVAAAGEWRLWTPWPISRAIRQLTDLSSVLC